MTELTVEHLSKRFPGVRALDRVNLRANGGKVLAVVGENGAGKSTLMKILAGVHRPDDGTMSLDAEPYRPAGVRDAIDRGVILIHQELNLAGSLSVGANLFLGREPTRGGWLHLLDAAAMRRTGRALLDRVGLVVPWDRRVDELPLGQQQLVEIARALSLKARVLIFDEPTASLTAREAERLFAVIGEVKRTGVAVIYISHRLAEVSAIADRVCVLRDGRNAGELDGAAATHGAIVRLMIGRDLKQFYTRRHGPKSGPPALEVRDFRYARGPAGAVNLRVGRGEIVGLAGLVGAGRTELAEALFGLRRRVSGSVTIHGHSADIRSPRDAIRHGLLLAPEDRRLHGLILTDGVRENLSLPNLDQFSTFGLIRRRSETAKARELVERLRIKTAKLSTPAGLLSGGNQQKIVFGRWIARGPRVLVLDEPTRGVDVGARGEIYALIDDLTAEGVGVLMISSDLEEVLGLSDRVVVLHEGRVAGELTKGSMSEQAIMHLATGGR